MRYLARHYARQALYARPYDVASGLGSVLVILILLAVLAAASYSL